MFLYSLPETLPVLQNADSSLGVLCNRTAVSSQLNIEQADERSWRRKVIFRSEYLARKWPQECLEPGGGWALEGVLMLSNQSGNTWL
jgi:hypothetical protein